MMAAESFSKELRLTNVSFAYDRRPTLIDVDLTWLPRVDRFGSFFRARGWALADEELALLVEAAGFTPNPASSGEHPAAGGGVAAAAPAGPAAAPAPQAAADFGGAHDLGDHCSHRLVGKVFFVKQRLTFREMFDHLFWQDVNHVSTQR